MNVKLYITDEAFANGLTIMKSPEIINVAKSKHYFYFVLQLIMS